MTTEERLEKLERKLIGTRLLLAGVVTAVVIFACVAVGAVLFAC